MNPAHLNPTPQKENAWPVGRPDQAYVSASHYDVSLARSRKNATRWLPNHGSYAGQLLLELIERAASDDDRGVTPRDFYRSAWSQLVAACRMAAHIHRLRRGGWMIETELREGSNWFEKVQHATYHLRLDIELEGVDLEDLGTDWLVREAALAALYEPDQPPFQILVRDVNLEDEELQQWMAMAREVRP